MTSKIQSWGNSQGLRLSKALLSRAGMAVGDEVDIEVRDGTLIVTPLRRVRGAHDLEELLSRIPEGHRPEELDWGEPVGREVW